MSDKPIVDFLARVRGRLVPQPLQVVNVSEDDIAHGPGNFSAGLTTVDTGRSTQRTTATLENDLTFTVFSALTLTVQLAGLVKRPDGTTQPIGPGGAGFIVSAIGDRVTRSVTFARGSGVDVIGLSVVAISPTPVPLGACWAIVQQSRTLADGSRVITSTLLSGPVSTTQPLGWPGSPVTQSTSVAYIRNITATLPGAGNELHEVVPLGARWEVQVVRWLLTTSGAGVQRDPLWITLSSLGAINFFSSAAPATVGPGNSKGYNWAQGLGITQDALVNGVTGPLPFGRILNAGNAWGTLTINLDPGDVYSSVEYVVRESLDP